MKLLHSLLTRAENGGISLWLLNLVLLRIIPFNKPLGVRVVSLSNNAIQVRLPYRRSNFNHLRGLHACALATAAEYACGLLLLRKLGATRYRLIMKELRCQYMYQGRSSAHVEVRMEEEYFQTAVLDALQHSESVEIPLHAEVLDSDNNQLCRTELVWQVKEWTSVRTPHTAN